jgi:hypothetical protein
MAALARPPEGLVLDGREHDGSLLCVGTGRRRGGPFGGAVNLGQCVQDELTCHFSPHLEPALQGAELTVGMRAG